MLTPKQLAHIPDPIMALVAELEDSIIRDISRRITKADYLTPTAEWQLYKASVLRKSSAEVMKEIARYTGKSQREIKKLMTEACMEAIHTDAEIYRKAGKETEAFLRSVALANTIRAGIKTANGLMSNFTQTTAITARRALTQALDRAYLEVNSGAFTYQQAITRAVSALGSEGLKVVKYASGRTDQMDVAVRRAVLTSVSQTAGTLQLQLAEEMGSDLVEVTEHLGARPSHAEWQGKIYSISGKSKKYPKLSEATGYGTGAGLKGWNCRHDFYPWYEGISVLEGGKVDPKENAKEYEESQRQRAFERSIRKSKRRLTALDESIRNTDDPILKEQLQRKFDRSAVTLKNQETKMKEWLKLTGRRADNARLQSNGFNRSVSGKAVWRAKKKLTLPENSGIVKTEKQSDLGYIKQKLQSDKRVSKEYYTTIKEKFSHGTKNAKRAFAKYVPENSVENAVFEETPRYVPASQKILMNYNADLHNERGSGVTWFHEHGHMIDDLAGQLSNDEEFLNLLNSDVMNYRMSIGKKYNLKTFDKVDKKISSELNQMREHSAVSDMLEGLTKGNIRGCAGHEVPGGDPYWNDALIRNEAFAHMYEAQFDKVRYLEMKKIFPNSLKYFENKLLKEAAI